MKTHLATTALAALTTLSAGFGPLSGCADPISAAAQPCPCAVGYICCDTGLCSPDQSSCEDTSATLFGLVKGQWVGYLENYSFLSGSDAIRISLEASDNGVASGKVVFGSAPPPPAAQPGDTFWPAVSQADLTAIGPDVLEGATYSARDLRWEQRRLRFTIVRNEPWEPFCAVQPTFPVADAPGGYQCLPERVIWSEVDRCTLQDSREPVDCRVASVCDSGSCVCTADGCHAAAALGYTFDLALEGDFGNGSTSMKRHWDGVTNIRLERI
jgi:hypothetical protein